MNWKTSTGEKENSLKEQVHVELLQLSICVWTTNKWQCVCANIPNIHGNGKMWRLPSPHSNGASSHCKQAKMCERNGNKRCLFLRSVVVVHGAWVSTELLHMGVCFPFRLAFVVYKLLDACNQQANGQFICGMKRVWIHELIRLIHCNSRRLNNMKCVIMSKKKQTQTRSLRKFFVLRIIQHAYIFKSKRIKLQGCSLWKLYVSNLLHTIWLLQNVPSYWDCVRISTIQGNILEFQ